MLRGGPHSRVQAPRALSNACEAGAASPTSCERRRLGYSATRLLSQAQLNDRPENIQAPALADKRGDEEEGVSNSRRVPSRPLTVVTGSGKSRE